MSELRGWLRLYDTRLSISGVRGWPILAIFLAIVVALPEARTLLAWGLGGGVVIGAMLIMLRRQYGGPGRGTPITLFPREATFVSSRA
jgi:hypothetical protein